MLCSDLYIANGSALYPFQYNGKTCVDYIVSDYNMNKCMNSYLSDSTVDATDTLSAMPNNCKAFLEYSINSHSVVISLATVTDGTALVAPTNWVPLCYK